MNVLSLFSGIGAFEKALDNLKIPYNLVGYCEIDKYASKSYSLIHNVSEDMNLKDVTKIDEFDILDDVDLITYGFPCQDISNAGKRKGFKDENGERTRSGLFFEALRIIEDYKPKFAIAENVKALVGKKFTEEFDIVLDSLDKAGYNNYWQVLNSKDYGIPQNRERVFIISIRKDIDKGFMFPTPRESSVSIFNLFDEDVEGNYYLSESDLAKVVNTKFTKDNYKKDTFDLVNGTYPTDCIMDYRFDEGLRIRKNNLSPTLTTKSPSSLSGVPIIYKGGKLKQVSARECWRLMGFDDSDFDKLTDLPITQLYKQAGNSIVVDVLEAIFESLGETYEEFNSSY